MTLTASDVWRMCSYGTQNRNVSLNTGFNDFSTIADLRFSTFLPSRSSQIFTYGSVHKNKHSMQVYVLIVRRIEFSQRTGLRCSRHCLTGRNSSLESRTAYATCHMALKQMPRCDCYSLLQKKDSMDFENTLNQPTPDRMSFPRQRPCNLVSSTNE